MSLLSSGNGASAAAAAASECIFEARLDDATLMNKILSELNSDDYGVLVITRDKLRIVTAGQKTFQISASFAASAFQKYSFNWDKDYVNFRFLLREFIECINLLKDHQNVAGAPDGDDSLLPGEIAKTSMEIRYKRRSEPWRIRLENSSNCVIDCDLKVFDIPGDSMFTPMVISEDEETATVTFHSKKLYEFTSGLDLAHSDVVKLTMSPSSAGNTFPVTFSTQSTVIGQVDLEIYEDDTEIIKTGIQVSQHCLFGASYKTQFIKPALEALKTSNSMKMTCGSNGLLCLEHFHGTHDVNTFYTMLSAVP